MIWIEFVDEGLCRGCFVEGHLPAVGSGALLVSREAILDQNRDYLFNCEGIDLLVGSPVREKRGMMFDSVYSLLRLG